MTEQQNTVIFFPEQKITDKVHQMVPYAKMIHFQVGFDQNKQYLFQLPFSPKNIGNTIVPALHGGLIGGFLENASVVLYCLNNQDSPIPKVIDFSLDYLRAGTPEHLYASCELVRQGRRVANVTAKAWQVSPEKPVAVARVHLLLNENAS
ncbi:PaaI family thioesterase [Neisseria sp. Ec49-e6-T10]|uniref:PaaI family thioesterase n=1 Tax=Neisseria sp. Ec49-e6-T10 TaxID=3140744 RepID=UPI003EC0127D